MMITIDYLETIDKSDRIYIKGKRVKDSEKEKQIIALIKDLTK